MNTEYKNKILGFYKKEHRMPSYQEIAHILGLKSKNAVYKIVHKLIDHGVLQKDSSGKISPVRVSQEIPLLGLVEAGLPTTAEEETLDLISFDEYLVRDPEKTYVLEVKGDSMIEAGIHEGDLVIAERKGDPKDGDIVIAEVDGGWTMKYLRKKAHRSWLEPANKNYKPIYPEHDMRIGAIVRGVIRRY